MQIPLAALRYVYPSFDAVQNAEKRADIYQPQYQQIQQQQQQQQQLYRQPVAAIASYYPNNMMTSYDLQRAEQRAVLPAQPPPQQQSPLPQPSPAMAPPPTSYDPSALGYQQNPARPCEQCNGDCSNYLCYGCGGCPVEPQRYEPHYMYPYQKQDSGKTSHFSFQLFLRI